MIRAIPNPTVPPPTNYPQPAGGFNPMQFIMQLFMQIAKALMSQFQYQGPPQQTNPYAMGNPGVVYNNTPNPSPFNFYGGGGGAGGGYYV